jgi:hypothetical protein
MGFETLRGALRAYCRLLYPNSPEAEFFIDFAEFFL